MPRISETVAALPGGFGTVHAIRLGIEPFAELGANSESLSGSRVDSPCSCRAILKSAPVTLPQSRISAEFERSGSGTCPEFLRRGLGTLSRRRFSRGLARSHRTGVCKEIGPGSERKSAVIPDLTLGRRGAGLIMIGVSILLLIKHRACASIRAGIRMGRGQRSTAEMECCCGSNWRNLAARAD